MTDKETMTLALEALVNAVDRIQNMSPFSVEDAWDRVYVRLDDSMAQARDVLRISLEQPKDEPVAWMYTTSLRLGDRFITQYQSDLETFESDKVWPLYTRPQPDIDIDYARAIEAKLKEKNT